MPSDSTQPQPFDPSLFFGLFDTSGDADHPTPSYGRAQYGDSTAITLRGGPAFLDRARNFLSSFAESRRGIKELFLRPGAVPNSAFVCMAPERFRAALRLYFFTQLWRSDEAKRVQVTDSEGDFIETICLNEEKLSERAAQLAQLFWDTAMIIDYGVLPSYCPNNGTPVWRSWGSEGFGAESGSVGEYRVVRPETESHND